MRKAVLKFFCLILSVFSLWGCGGRPGVLSYEIGDGGVTITDCERSAEGEVGIPDENQAIRCKRCRRC